MSVRPHAPVRAFAALLAVLAAPLAGAVPLEFTASGQTAPSRAGGQAVGWTLRMIFDPAAMLPDSLPAPGTGAYGGASFLEVTIDGLVQVRTDDFAAADRGVIAIDNLAAPSGTSVSDAFFLGGTTLGGERFVVVFGQSSLGAAPPPSLLTSAELPLALADYEALLGAPSRTFQWGPTSAAPVVGLVETVAIRAVPVSEPPALPMALLSGLLLVGFARTRRRVRPATERSA